MGDGRYYTISQFSNIVFLTLLIIFVTVSVMLGLYKSASNKASKNILYIHICLGLVIVTRFTEEIVVMEQFASVIRYLSSLLFISANVLLIRFLVKYVVGPLLDFKNSTVLILKIIVGILLGLFLGCIYSDTSLIIKTYSFENIEFGIGYVLVLFMCALILICINTLILLKYEAKTKQNTPKFENVPFSITIFLLWIIPLLIYTSFIALNFVQTQIVELITYLLFAINLNLVAYYFMPYKVSSSIIQNVKDLMLDYVFIIDSSGKIMYRNHDVEDSTIFKKTTFINLQKIESIFSKEVIKRETYNKQFFKYSDEKTLYFSYSEKMILNKGIIAGHIITFVDITSLIEMLDQLKLKQQETEHMHNELSRYSKIVYNVEKEKEVNTLLTEIAQNQQKSMQSLKRALASLQKNSSEDCFMIDVEQVIIDAKRDLVEVRQAVSAYMSYYGGEDD